MRLPLTITLRRLLTALLAIVFAFFSGPLKAQTGDEEALRAELAGLQIAVEQLHLQVQRLSEARCDAKVTINDQQILTVDGRYHQALCERYDHQQRMRNHRELIYAWQLIASWVVLGLVVIVTIGGIGLAVYEVRGAEARAVEAAKKGVNHDKPETSLTVSAETLQITSVVTGVVILVVALAFLYLFVDRVYQIEEPANGGLDASAEQSSEVDDEEAPQG